MDTTINAKLRVVKCVLAERAKTVGYPERFAQEALGHNSKAVHRTYARRAEVLLPPLEDYEKKIIRLPRLDDAAARQQPALMA